MERIRYKDETCELVLFIDSTSITGYKVIDQEMFPITQKDLDVFSFLRNIDNLPSFFYKKGIPTTMYRGKGIRLGEERKLTFGQRVILCTIIGLTLLVGPREIPVVAKANDFIQFMKASQDYSVEGVLASIQASSYLTQEEKNFLKNEDLIEDVLKTVNTDLSTKALFLSYIHHIDIQSYGAEDPQYNSAYGYYNLSTPSTMFMKDYTGLNDKEDTLAHEYVHLLQDTSGYNLIIEACAEIVSTEYYGVPESYYPFQVQLLKVLMETIGSDVVWNYSFTGDFSGIEERVKPHLSEEEYQDFLDCLTFDYDDASANYPKYDRLRELISKLYKSIYHKDIEEDLIIQLINHYDFTLNRSYFNPRQTNDSYYLNYELGEYETLSYEDAINRGMILIFATQRTPISMDEAMEIVRNRNYAIHRDIDNNGHQVSFLRTSSDGVQMIVSVIIDGERYENIDIDELARRGILTIHYSMVKQKKLTYEEYRDHNYWEDAEIRIMHAGDTTLNEDTVVGFVPMKIVLPSIEERYQTQNQK